MLPDADPSQRARYLGNIQFGQDNATDVAEGQQGAGASALMLTSGGDDKKAENGMLVPSEGALDLGPGAKLVIENGRPCMVFKEGDKLPIPRFLLPGGLDAMMPVGAR